MRKPLLLLIIAALLSLSFPALTIAQENSPSTGQAEALLPDDTLFYANLPAATIPDELALLETVLLPEMLAGISNGWINDLSDSEFAPWIGERVAVAAYPIEGNRLKIEWGLLFQVRDEAAADAFLVDEFVNQQWQQRTINGVDVWTEPASLTGDPAAVARIPGYVIFSSALGLKALVETTPESLLLGDSDFRRVRSGFEDAEPLIWAYEGITNSGMALTLTEEALVWEAIQTRLLDSTQAGDPWNAQAIEGVPNGALFVAAGLMPIESFWNNLRLMGALIDVDIADLLDNLLSEVLGITWSSDLLPLMSGEGAAFLAYGRGTFYDEIGLPIEAGVIIAPQDVAQSGIALVNLTSAFENAGVSINQITPTFFEIVPPLDLPNILYGIEDDRLFISTESGTAIIREALTGRNLSDDRRWQDALAYAPESTQFVAYANLSGLYALVASLIGTMPQFQNESVKMILDYLRRFETAALFSGVQANELRVTRGVLLFR